MRDEPRKGNMRVGYHEKFLFRPLRGGTCRDQRFGSLGFCFREIFLLVCFFSCTIHASF